MRKSSLSLLIVGIVLLAAPAVSWAAGPAPQGNALGVLGVAPAISMVAETTASPQDSTGTTPAARPESIDINQNSTCTITINCDDGSQATCTGGSCSYTASNPPSSCGYVTCDSTNHYCPTHHRSIRVIGSCCFISGGQSQKWMSQVSCDNATWFNTGIYSCSGPCIQ